MIAVDLFCGAGGFSYGFELADIPVRYGVDKNEVALQTYEDNHTGTSIQYDLTEGLPDEIIEQREEIDIVIGSPPCQGFSDARGSRYVDTDSNGLVFEFIKFVEELNPDIVLMENVTGMTTISDEFMDGIITEFKSIGYDVTYKTLRASDFGVPQNRDRVILGGAKIASEKSFTFPTPTTNTTPPTVYEAIGDLPEPTESGIVKPKPIDDCNFDTTFLQKIQAEETTNHIAKEPASDSHTTQIVDSLEPGEMYRSNRFGERYRQVWDVLSTEFTAPEQDVLEFIARHRTRKDYRIKGKTVGPVNESKIQDELEYSNETVASVLTELYDNEWIRTDTIDGVKGFDLNTKSGIRPRYMRLTPDEPANTILTTDFKPRDKLHPFKNRGLSLREGARLQSFPDDFTFSGTFNQIGTQIGNAVPPLLAFEIAKEIQS